MKISIFLYELLIIATFFLGGIVGFYIRRYIAESKIQSAEKEAKKIKEEALKQAEIRAKEMLSKDCFIPLFQDYLLHFLFCLFINFLNS